MECIPCISGALAIGSVTLPGVQHQLTKERTAEVISFLNQSGVHRLIIAGGGEPFLSESTVDRMVEIIVGAKKVDFIEVITNGLWARDTARMKRILHRINEALEERGPSAAKVSFTFSFSVDGFHQKNGMAGAAHFIAERAHRRGIVFPASNAPVTVLFQIIKGKGALGAFQALQEQLADRGVLDLGDLEEKIKPDRVGAYEQGEMKFIAGDLGAACFRYTIFPLYTTNRLMRALAAGTISPEDVLPYQKDLWSRSYQYGIYYEQVFSEAVAYHLLSIDTDGAVSPECRSALDRKGLLAGNVSEGFSIVQKRDKQDPLMRVLRQKGVGVMKAVFAKIDPEYAQRISVFASPYDTLDELLVDEDMRLRVTFGLLRYECWDSLTKRSQEAVAALEARFFPQGLQLPGRQIPVSTGGDRAEMNSV